MEPVQSFINHHGSSLTNSQYQPIVNHDEYLSLANLAGKFPICNSRDSVRPWPSRISKPKEASKMFFLKGSPVGSIYPDFGEIAVTEPYGI